MKLLSTILLYASLLIVPPQRENDLTAELLRGKVKSCTVTLYSLSNKNGEQVKIFVQKIRTEYNIQGFRTKKVSTRPYSDVKTYIYEYNNKGELVNHPYILKTSKVLKDGSRIEKKKSSIGYDEIRTYGSDLLLKERITVNKEGKTVSKSTFVYNKEGYVTKSEDFNGDGKLVQTFIYEYDHYHNLLKTTVYNPQNIQTSKTTFTYASGNGPVVEKVVFTKSSSGLERFTTVRYSNADANKNWLQSIQTRIADNATLNVREIEYYPD